MALSFSKKTYSDTASSGNGITASDMNRIENAIASLTSAVNAINVKFSIAGDDNRIRFVKSGGNGNFEIWFNFGNDSTCLAFSMNNIGVYDSKTQQGWNVK